MGIQRIEHHGSKLGDASVQGLITFQWTNCCMPNLQTKPEEEAITKDFACTQGDLSTTRMNTETELNKKNPLVTWRSLSNTHGDITELPAGKRT